MRPRHYAPGFGQLLVRIKNDRKQIFCFGSHFRAPQPKSFEILGKYQLRCKSVDDECRKIIDNSNYRKYFIHSTGHGIGLDVHELPTIGPKSTTKLQNNMAITVEPGIYIPKKFGVRIEDSLIVKNKKPLLLHKFTKELLTL